VALWSFTGNKGRGISKSDETMNRTGFYCEDCDRIMDASSYGDHNSDHTLKAIVWDFLGKPEVSTKHTMVKDK